MSATQGAWECRHGVDGRDHCPACFAPVNHDPATRWDKLKALTLLVLAFGAVLTVLVSYCLTAHGGM